ncbi:MAG: response regulator [Chloroflexi bacterium]|nr:response regulator [Chloroflexota bacterium]
MTFPQHYYAKDWVVLLIDDEEDNLHMAQLTLEHWGAQVHAGKNGIEGMKLLETLDPSVILLDLSMPEMDGWAMYRKVREQEKYNAVPIIALTAHAMSTDKAKVLEAGFDGYITKPFMIDSFMERIQECINRRQAQYGPANSSGQESVVAPAASPEPNHKDLEVKNEVEQDASLSETEEKSQ